MLLIDQLKIYFLFIYSRLFSLKLHLINGDGDGAEDRIGRDEWMVDAYDIYGHASPFIFHSPLCPTLEISAQIKTTASWAQSYHTSYTEVSVHKISFCIHIIYRFLSE